MTKQTSKELTTVASEKSVAILDQEYPKEQSFSRILLPRIVFISTDKTEGKGKNMKVVAEAGTFFLEKPNADGEWEKEELGKEIDVNIIYHRRQLRYWDAANESFVNSPVYDTDDDVIPLFQDKKEIDRGTQKELQAKYPPKEGRRTSALEDERILYVLYEGNPYQMSIKGGNKWAFFTYARKVNPATVLTTIGSEEKENGSITWNQMVFTEKSKISEKEAQEIISRVGEIKESIKAEKAYYQSMDSALKKPADDDFEVK